MPYNKKGKKQPPKKGKPLPNKNETTCSDLEKNENGNSPFSNVPASAPPPLPQPDELFAELLNIGLPQQHVENPPRRTARPPLSLRRLLQSTNQASEPANPAPSKGTKNQKKRKFDDASKKNEKKPNFRQLETSPTCYDLPRSSATANRRSGLSLTLGNVNRRLPCSSTITSNTPPDFGDQQNTATNYRENEPRSQWSTGSASMYGSAARIRSSLRSSTVTRPPDSQESISDWMVTDEVTNREFGNLRADTTPMHQDNASAMASANASAILPNREALNSALANIFPNEAFATPGRHPSNCRCVRCRLARRPPNVNVMPEPQPLRTVANPPNRAWEIFGNIDVPDQVSDMRRVRVPNSAIITVSGMALNRYLIENFFANVGSIESTEVVSYLTTIIKYRDTFMYL